MQCLSCGLVQLSNPPVSYYKDVITAASLSPSARNKRLDELTRISKEWQLDGASALEIGCGSGDMVGVLDEVGFEATGIENSIDLAKDGTDKGYKCIQSYISDYIPEKKHDFFLCLNYLEHQPDVKDFLFHLRRVTSESAMGYVTVPNLKHLIDSNCMYEFVADHLNYFTQETFESAFVSNGFEVIKSELINNSNDISLIVRKREYLNIDPLHESVKKLCVEFSMLVKSLRHSGKRVAIWGAGHRTLALIAICKSIDIDFIVDSASFKIGKYSPISHLKIVSPEQFSTSNIDSVIVMVPGIYPNEVIKKIIEIKPEVAIYKLVENQILGPIDTVKY